jgi:hypothetical protein
MLNHPHKVLLLNAIAINIAIDSSANSKPTLNSEYIHKAATVN